MGEVVGNIFVGGVVGEHVIANIFVHDFEGTSSSIPEYTTCCTI